MLNEEIKKFEELTGHSANDYSMEFLGGFWFGYDTAKKEGYRLGNAEYDATQYSTGYQDGFLEAKKLFTDPENAAALEKITAEIVSLLKDIMPQVVKIAKENATGNGMKEGQADE